VITSPLIAIAAYERERGFPKDWLNVLMYGNAREERHFRLTCNSTGHGNTGSWQRFERGEMGLYAFYTGFSNDLSDVEKGRKWYADYCRKRKIGRPT
jgi:hypothetical protein